MIGVPRRHVEHCESTQLLLGPDDPEGAIATADHQTGGRGRLGRRWEEAPATAVLLSVLLRPPPGRRAPELTLVAAVAVAQAVEDATGLPAQIKWPNDVLLGARKVAGILAELRDGVVVLGIGLNVNQVEEELPERRELPAGSLRLADGRERDREQVLGLLLGRLDAAYAAWLAGALAALAPELDARDHLRGRAVTADGIAGVAEGIAADGRLRLRTASGEVLVESGEIAVPTQET